MTFVEREEIFSKDYISTKELQKLLGMKNECSASQKMCEIKRVVGERLGIKGRIHTEDYFEFFNIKTERYSKTVGDNENV